MLVYCAGPLDDVSYEEGRNWYEEAKRLAPAHATLFFPGHAYSNPQNNPQVMDTINRIVIVLSDALLVNLSGPGKALGTCREIEYARHYDKPVVVVANNLASLLTYDLIIVDNIKDAWENIDYLVHLKKSESVEKITNTHTEIQ